MMGTLALFVYTQEYRIFMQFVRVYLPSTRTRNVNVLPSSYSPLTFSPLSVHIASWFLC